MTEWEPATEAEAAMREALRGGDQEEYFRILARTELLLPVSADSISGQAPVGWGTWTTSGRTHVLAFTSGVALQACLADNAGSARRMAYQELAAVWPNLEWWLAVNPGLPIEGYLPAWFVTQLARGDVRLPGRSMGARARMDKADSAARARATAVVPGRIAPPGAEPTSPAPASPTPASYGTPSPGGSSSTPTPEARAASASGMAAAAAGRQRAQEQSAGAREQGGPSAFDGGAGPDGQGRGGAFGGPGGAGDHGQGAGAAAGGPGGPGEGHHGGFGQGTAGQGGPDKDSSGPGGPGRGGFGQGAAGHGGAGPGGFGGPGQGGPRGAGQGGLGGLTRRTPGANLAGADQGGHDPQGMGAGPRGFAPESGPSRGTGIGGSSFGAPDGQPPGLGAAEGQPLGARGFGAAQGQPASFGGASGPPPGAISPLAAPPPPPVPVPGQPQAVSPLAAPPPPPVPVPGQPQAVSPLAAPPPPPVPVSGQPEALAAPPPPPVPATDQPAPSGGVGGNGLPRRLPGSGPAIPLGPIGANLPPIRPGPGGATAGTPPASQPSTASAPPATSAPSAGRAPATSEPPASQAPAASGAAASPVPAASGAAATSAPQSRPWDTPPGTQPPNPATTGTPQREQAPPAPPVPVDFKPANDVEKSLLAAAAEGSTDTFLSTLLLAKVLLPVSPVSADGTRPGEPGFAWLTETIDGETYVVVFTSVERLQDHLGETIETIDVKFMQLIKAWPDPEWSFAVNPSTPVGAKLPGAQILALANWAADVGLNDSEEAEPAALPISKSAAADPSQPTLMQKAVAPSQVDYYLERGYDRVSGFVHRANEVAHLNTPAKMYAALGLGYAGSAFKRDADEIFVLRWPAHRPSLYRIPYGGQNEPAMRAMEGWVIERAPFRGNGFAPSESGDVIAEFKVDSARLPHGAQLWRITADGNEKLVALLDADTPTWRKVGNE